MMIDELTHMISQNSDDPIGILIISSLVREDFPWLYEIGAEAYRTAKAGNIEEAREALKMFRNAARFTMRGPFMEELGVSPKEMHMMFDELPMIIDHYMERWDRPIRKRPPRKRIKSDEEGKNS